MTSDPQKRARQSLLAAGLLAFMLLGGGQAVMGPALPVFQRIFSIDIASAGWLISSLGIGSFSGLVVLYFFGRHATPRMALLGMAAGAALIGLSPTFPLAVLACILFGLGFGCVAALFNARVLGAFGPKGPSMVSLLNAGYSVGAIFAPLIFVGFGSQPRLLFILIAALCIVALLISGKAASSRSVPQTEGIPAGFRFHFPILAFGLIGIGVEVSLTGLGPSAMIRAGIEPARAAELLSAFFVAFLAGRLALTLLADRIPPFAIYTGATLGTSLCAFGCVLFNPAWFFPLMGGAAGLIFPGYFVTAAAKMGSDNRVAPVILATTQIGAVVAPLMIAQLVPVMGDRGFFWVIGGTTAGLTLIALASYRQMAR